jgi:methylmalonyl-CoA mutase C-terminal domain/subunit
MEHIVLFGGGIIPPEDAAMLCAEGVAAIFGPGASLKEIVAFVEQAVRPGRTA